MRPREGPKEIVNVPHFVVLHALLLRESDTAILKHLQTEIQDALNTIIAVMEEEKRARAGEQPEPSPPSAIEAEFEEAEFRRRRNIGILEGVVIPRTLRRPEDDGQANEASADATRDIFERLQPGQGLRLRKRFEEVGEFLNEGGSYVFLGANGEFIARPSDGAECGSVALFLLPRKEGFELVSNLDLDGLGIRYLDTYGYVSAYGEVRLAVEATGAATQLGATPKQWPYKNAEGRPEAPPEWAVIAGRTLPDGAPKAAPPEGAAGWALLEWAGNIVAPTPEMERPENVLWVVPKEGGFEFIHSGPLREGVYGTIHADRRVTFGPGAPPSLRERVHQYWWPFRVAGKPVTIPPGNRGQPTSDPSARYVFDGPHAVGLISTRPVLH